MCRGQEWKLLLFWFLSYLPIDFILIIAYDTHFDMLSSFVNFH